MRQESGQPVSFEGPLLLFLLSAAVGLWIAGGQPDAWKKFWMIVGGLVVYGILVRIPDSIHAGGLAFSPLRLLWIGLPIFVIIYFLVANDWTRWIQKMPGLNLTAPWFPVWRPPPSYWINPNVAGGIIAVFLPLQLAALTDEEHKTRVTRGAVIAVGFSVLGLIMTLSRGAWLGSVAVMVGWALWRLIARWGAAHTIRLWATIVFSLLAVASLTYVRVFQFTPVGSRLLAFVEHDRVAVWRMALDLLDDYPFTGLGLGNFQMAHASFVLLVHVGHTFYAHNLLLDLWLEQGLLGVLAFGWLVIRALRANVTASHWRLAALASLAVMLLHGLVDDPLYGAGGLPALLLFVPFVPLSRGQDSAVSMRIAQRKSYVAFLAGVPVIVFAAGLLIPSVQADLQANLGAALQTRAELFIYRWPEWPIQDELRRSPRIDLAPAIAHYQNALRLDPGNATANRRLGQIELSLGRYDSACRHLQQAYRTAPGQRATRQLLGECYAIAGDVTQASALWRTVDVSEQQLVLRQWWYEHLGEKQSAEWIKQAAEALH